MPGIIVFSVVDVTQTGVDPEVIAFNELATNPVLGLVTITSYGASVGLNESGRVAIIEVADPRTVDFGVTNVESSDLRNLTSTFVAKFVPVIVVVLSIFGRPLGVISVIVGGAQTASFFDCRLDMLFSVNVKRLFVSALTVVTYKNSPVAVIREEPFAE